MSTTAVRVWDLPTRIFHWALVLHVLGLFATGLTGTAMAWHLRLGYGVLCLLLFRLVWGLIGGYWSRFRAFVYGPRTVWAYLHGRAQPEHEVGHNPLGAGSVFAMLGFLALQVASGLCSDDEISSAGPLVRWLDASWVQQATHYHKQIGKWVVLGLVVLHLGAIALYFFKQGNNLVRPMWTGDKLSQYPVAHSRDDLSSRTVAAVVLAACVALLTWALQRLA